LRFRQCKRPNPEGSRKVGGDSGAHAIAVDKIKRDGEDTFGVIALYEKEPDDPLPASLEIEQDGNKKGVPLAAMITPRATPE